MCVEQPAGPNEECVRPPPVALIRTLLRKMNRSDTPRANRYNHWFCTRFKDEVLVLDALAVNPNGTLLYQAARITK